jgi:hypothetical protein
MLGVFYCTRAIGFEISQMLKKRTSYKILQ